MTAAVRMFSHSELEVLPVSAASARLSVDSVFVVGNYLAKEAFSVSPSTQSDSATATAPAGTRILRVEVETGKEVAFEFTPANATLATVSATTSPRLTGKTTLPFGAGWRISFLDVST